MNTRPNCSLLDLGGLLEDLLGCRVDFVAEDGLRPGLRARVLREAVAAMRAVRERLQDILDAIAQISIEQTKGREVFRRSALSRFGWSITL